MCFVRLLITGDRHLGSVVISASCPSSDARSRLRFYNLMNLSAPEQAAVQIIQIYLLFSRSLGGFQYFRIERIISGDWSRKYDKCYCHKMITIQIFQYYLYLYLLPLLLVTLQVLLKGPCVWWGLFTLPPTGPWPCYDQLVRINQRGVTNLSTSHCAAAP